MTNLHPKAGTPVVIDLDSNAELALLSTAEDDAFRVEYKDPETKIRITIRLEQNLLDNERISIDLPRQGVMISSWSFDQYFRAKSLTDVESNTLLVDKIVRMISCVLINTDHENQHYLWSDYYKQPSGHLYRMHSNAALLLISQDPMANVGAL